MKTCKTCKNMVNNKAKICPDCGSKFDNNENVKLYTVKIKNKENDTNSNNKKPLDNSNKALISNSHQNNHIENNETINIKPPKYHFYLVFSSVFFSFFWFVPFIGLVSNIFAFIDLYANDYKYKDKYILWSFVSLIIHLLYTINAILSN